MAYQFNSVSPAVNRGLTTRSRRFSDTNNLRLTGSLVIAGSHRRHHRKYG
jgi:hypothetical protein